MIKDIHEVKECPERGSAEITHNEKTQQVVCRSCGLIYEPMATKSQEQFDKAAKFRRS